jgi:CHAT domain-containing protein
MNFVVDQFKEIALRVGGRKCAMTAQIIELQKENDTLAKRLEESENQLLNQTQKQKLEQQKKNMEEKVLKLTTHNESLIKERKQSKMKILELKKRNNMLNVDLARGELAKVETKQKLEKTVERLKKMKEKNLELHTVIIELDH